jgi:hypothetical protein
MSASYLLWPGASAEIPDEKTDLLRPGIPAGRSAARLRQYPAHRGTVRRPGPAGDLTLYAALDRLTADGYVEMVREEIINGRVQHCSARKTSPA